MITENIKQLKLSKEFLKLMNSRGCKNIKGYVMGEFTILLSHDGGEWHLSISGLHRYATDEEIKKVHKTLLPGIPMEITDIVRSKRHTIHLFEVKERAQLHSPLAIVQ